MNVSVKPTMNRIFSISLLALLLVGSVATAQITDDPEDRRGDGKQELKTQTPEGRPLPFTQRLRFGGGIGPFGFGGGVTQLGVSPIVAYNASERLILGVGLSYVYTRLRPFSQFSFTGSTINQIGGRGFAMFEVVPELVPNLYAHAELESTSVIRKDDTIPGSYSISYTAPLIGATYMQPISRRFGINLTVLYNLNYSSNPSNSLAYLNSSPIVLRVAFF
jgi:hypothetical protein